MVRFAPEGYPFMIFFAAVTVITAALAPYGATIPLLLTLFMFYFFRDPERCAPAVGNVFVSPADGKVILIRDVFESKYLVADMKEISIFMSPLDVHVNRAPCEGKVKSIHHNKGGFTAAYRDEASVRNENIELVLETKNGDILIRQVAGFVARRAVCRKKEGDPLRMGERYGIIKFSSRLDIYLPKNTEISVGVGERVKAGESIIGKI